MPPEVCREVDRWLLSSSCFFQCRFSLSRCQSAGLLLELFVTKGGPQYQLSVPKEHVGAGTVSVEKSANPSCKKKKSPETKLDK